MNRFYTVRYQVPLAWKLFIFISVAVVGMCFFSSGFRGLFYKAVPLKFAALYMNSKVVEDDKNHLDLHFNGKVIYSLSKYKIHEIEPDTGKVSLVADRKTLSRSGGKFSSLSCIKQIGDVLYAGDWYGKIYLGKAGKWTHIKSAGKYRILDFHYEDGRLLASSWKGLKVKEEKESQLKNTKIKKAFNNFTTYKGKLMGGYIYELLSSEDAGRNWKTELTLTKEQGRAQGVSATKDERLVIWADKGLHFSDGKSITETHFQGEKVSFWCEGDEIEAAAVHKKAIALRYKKGLWVRFGTSANVSAMVIVSGRLWMAVHGKGLIEVDVKRLFELEGIK